MPLTQKISQKTLFFSSVSSMRKTNEFSTPFGVGLKNRDFTSEKYRYGFNGMEKDDEVKGKGNSYDFGARMMDSRLGRWLSVDAKISKMPYLSPYSFVDNCPLKNIDINGDYIYLVYQAYDSEKNEWVNKVKKAESLKDLYEIYGLKKLSLTSEGNIYLSSFLTDPKNDLYLANVSTNQNNFKAVNAGGANIFTKKDDPLLKDGVFDSDFIFKEGSKLDFGEANNEYLTRLFTEFNGVTPREDAETSSFIAINIFGSQPGVDHLGRTNSTKYAMILAHELYAHTVLALYGIKLSEQHTEYGNVSEGGDCVEGSCSEEMSNQINEFDKNNQQYIEGEYETNGDEEGPKMPVSNPEYETFEEDD